MATLTIHKPNETQQTASTFQLDVDMLTKPEQALKSVFQSTLFTRQMIAVSISTICYTRNIFPKEYFVRKQIGGLKIQILRNVKKDKKVTRFLDWIRGSFEAMQKGYLRDIIFGVQPPGDDNLDKALESYIFHVKYGNVSKPCEKLYGSLPNQHIMEIQASTDITAKSLEANIIDCIQKCVDITNSMQALPQGCSVGMMLTYHEGTPDEYEPPGFKPSEFASYIYPDGHKEFEIAKISTPYHTVSMETITAYIETQDMIDDSDFVPASGSSTQEMLKSTSEIPVVANFSAVQHTKKSDLVEMDVTASKLDVAPDNNKSTNVNEIFTPNMKSIFEKSFEKPSRWVNDGPLRSDPLPMQLAETKTNRPIFTTQHNSNNYGLNDTTNNDDSEKADTVTTYGEVNISCVCENDNEFHIMICCQICGFWNHGACYGYLSKPSVTEAHICVSCSDINKTIKCSDSIIASLSKSDRINLAYTRMVLSHCDRHVTFRLEALFRKLGVPEYLQNFLIEKLETLSILKPAKSHLPPLTIKRTVNKKMLKKHLLEYFPLESGHSNVQGASTSYAENMRIPLVELININQSDNKGKASGNRKRMILDPVAFEEMCRDAGPSKKRKVSNGKRN